jgi:hypothetical protein
VNVTVTPTGPASHLTAYLYAVDGEGDETEVERLGWGQVDLRYAQAARRPGRSSPARRST